MRHLDLSGCRISYSQSCQNRFKRLQPSPLSDSFDTPEMHEMPLPSSSNTTETSTRALAATHVTLRLIGESHLNSSFVGLRQDFLLMYINYIYDYQEQTSDQPENQLAEPRVINYLQEAVRDDKDLNHSRHREMPCITEGKVEMSIGRYIKALIDLAILTDQSNPRKNTSDGRHSPRNAHRLEIEPDYGDDQDSEDEEDSVGESAMSY